MVPIEQQAGFAFPSGKVNGVHTVAGIQEKEWNGVKGSGIFLFCSKNVTTGDKGTRQKASGGQECKVWDTLQCK
jgi:hypothetical protein